MYTVGKLVKCYILSWFCLFAYYLPHVGSCGKFWPSGHLRQNLFAYPGFAYLLIIYPMMVHVGNFGQVDTFVKIYLLSGFAYLLIIYPMLAHVGNFGQVDTFVKIYLLNSLFSLYRY